MKTFVKILSMLVAVIMLGSVGAVGLTAYAEPSDVLGEYDFTVVDNPYENIVWYEKNPNLHAFKASTHAHTVRSDADIELNDTIWEHYMKGYEVLCLTDHGTVNGVNIKDEKSNMTTGTRYENGWSCGWTENQDRCALYAYQSFVHGNIDEITKEDYYDVIEGVERDGRPQALVEAGRGMFNLPLGNEANEASGNKCHVNTYNVSIYHGSNRNVEWPASTVGGAYDVGAFSRINHVGEWTDGNGNPGVYNESWVNDFVSIFEEHCPNREGAPEGTHNGVYTENNTNWNTTNNTNQKVKKGVIGIELVNTSDNRTRNDRFYVYDASLMKLAPQGINMYGFCEDDSHEESDVNKNAQYFLVNDGTAWSEEDKAYYGKHYPKANEPWFGYTGDIIRSMTNGEFYACSVNSKNSYELGDGFVASGAYPALRYFNIDEKTDQVTLKVTNSSKVRLVADGNIIATKTISENSDDTTVTFDLNAYETQINSYIRIYMTGKGGITYLQPILLSKSENKQSYVQFVLPSKDTTLAVYDASGVVSTDYTDNIFVLEAGEYSYTATRKGYYSKTDTFIVTQAEIEAGTQKTITVELEKDETISQLYFYAPETIYLNPADNKTFKYYVDRENADDGDLIADANKTTGNVYFHLKGATEINISATKQEGAAVSISSYTLNDYYAKEEVLATELKGGTLSAAITDDQYILITWKAEYIFEGKDYVAYTYSYVYPAPNPTTKTLGAGGKAETKKPFWGAGWPHSDMRVVSSVFVYGVHTVSTTDANGYQFAPYYYTGDSFSSTDTRVNGAGYKWDSDDSDGGSVPISPTGGTGIIYADISRINGFQHVPLFTFGMDINDATQCTGEEGNENYITLDMSCGGLNRSFVDLRNQSNLTQYSAKRIYQLNNATDSNYEYNFVGEENEVYTLTGVAQGSKFSRADTVTSVVYINVIKVDKSELRDLYNAGISQFYQQEWFTSTNEYTAYLENLIKAAKVLGNPAATPEDVDEAYNNLKNAEENVQLKTGSAQVKHYWIYNNQSGEILSEPMYTYTLTDVLVANATKFEGFTYLKEYKRFVDNEVVASGSAEFESISAKEDNYTWIFYYIPNTYDISYYTGTDNFKPEGGTGSFALYNQNYTITTSKPSRSGYVFKGWYLDIDPTYTVYSSGDTIHYGYMDNGQFIAKWEPLTYSVTYDLNGGEFADGKEPASEELRAVYDNTYTITTLVPEREGYNFVGWKVNGGETYTSGGQFTWDFAANGTLEAQWSNIGYKVTYDPVVEGATVTPETGIVYYDKTYGTLATAQRTGYSYQWYSNPEFPENALVTAETIVKIPADHTLYAKWAPITYTITYNLDGGEVAGNNPTTYNIESNPIKLVNPTKTGYTFVGWSGTGLSTTSYTMDVTIPTGEHGNREYKANWKTNVYTITYNLNADASSASPPVNAKNPTTYTYVDNITILPPTRAGYTFGGWTGEGYSNIDTIIIPAGTKAEDLTFNASWNIITYEIKYNFNGGTAGVNYPTQYTVETGFTVSDPYKGGYEFYGWQSDALASIEKGLTRPAGTTGNYELNAIWQGIEGTVVYELNGGVITGTNPSIYTTGGERIKLTNPTKAGYDFSGWDKLNVINSTTLYKQMEAYIESTDSGTLIFTAQWSPTNFSITYDLHGGHYEIAQSGNLETYNAETETFTLTNPIKEGYIFAGWTGTDIAGSSKSVTVQKGSTGTRVYDATWTVATYTITYDYAGGASDISHIASYTFETEDKEILAPVRTGYTFTGWTQTFQNFTWKPGELDKNGYYNSCDSHYLSSPILVRKGYTYTLTAGGDLRHIQAYLFDKDRKFAISVNVADQNVLQIPTEHLKNDKYFIYFVVSDEFLAAAYRDTIKINVVDNSDEFASEGKQKTVAIPTGSTGNIKLEASWEVETYNLTYDLAGGHFNQYDANGNLLEKGDEGYIENYDPNPTEFTVESRNILLQNPTKDGYSFLGWSDGKITSPTVVIRQGSTGSRHYTAEWAETMYSIRYELNGGVVAGTNPSNYYHSSKDIKLINPTRAGYSFGGWTGTDINGVSFDVTIPTGSTGNRVYTATWTPDTYNISYVLNGGVNASANPNTYTFETETFTLAHPTKAGASFAGWTGTGLDSSTMTVTINQGSTGDRVYTANWNVSNYNISYNLAGGINNAKNPMTYTVDTETFTLAHPSRTGYSFSGWTGTGLTEATEYVTITKGSTGNRIYTATWTPIIYTINYVLGSGAQVGVANPASYTIETSTFTLNNPVRAGYVFEGWTGTGIETSSGFAKTVTVYKGSTGTRSYVAMWTVEEFTITYALNGGTANNPTKYTITSPDITLNAPTRTGYEFVAWSGTGITGTGFAKEVVIPTGSSGNRSYTANWEIIEYNITYDLAGGEETISNPKKYNYLTAQITLHSPVKPGFDFVGWIDSADETQTPQKVIVIPTNSTGDRHYTAVWKEGRYTISYDLDGGKWADEDYVEINEYTYDTETFTVPQPEKEGYVFAGWSGTGISGTSLDLTIHQNSTGDRTYKAHWSEGSNIITYDLAGGRMSGDENPTSYVTGSGEIILNNPVRSGYRFAGWIGSRLSKATMEVVIDTDEGGALSYTATWNPVSYRITYTLGGGKIEGTANKTTYTAEDQFTLTNPVRTGYTFKGWTGTDLTGTQSTVTVVKGSTGARAYTAVWEEAVYKISYDYGEGSVAVSNPIDYTYTTPTFALNNPTLTGYDFLGWTGTNGTTPQMTIVIEKGSLGDRTYKANYSINTYTIKYIGVDGATFTGAPTTYTAAQSVTIPTPSKVGYIFKGWSGTGINGIAAEVVIAKGSAGNRVYTAEWEAIEYSLTYKLNSGRVSGVNPSVYTVESADISILNPGRPGYTFGGWTKTLKNFIWMNGTIDSTGAYVSGSGYWSMPVSLTAGETYTFADGIAIAVYKLDGTFVCLATSPYTAKEDCYCAVIVTGEKSETELAAITIVANDVMSVEIPRGSMGNIDLVANWKSQEFTITYYLNGGEVAGTNPDKYTADTPTFKLYNPTKSGYIFNGWTGTDLSSATTDVVVATGSTGNRVYTANWRVERYYLTIELDGGTFGSATVPEFFTIDTATFSLPIPTKAGFTFTGWIDKDGIVWKTVTISKGTTGDKSYTAQWEENTAGTHKFYYYGMNNQLLGVETVSVGTAPVGMPYQVVVGYEFAGWSVNLNDKAVINSTDDFHVYSTYKVGPDKYAITVNGTTTEYTQYATVKVTADETDSNGKAFSYWRDENSGAIVSYYRSFSFKAHADISIVAVYGATESVDKVTTRITKAEYDGYHRWISFYAERSVDSAYTVLQHGIMFTDNYEIAKDADKFVLGTNGVYASTASSTSRSGVYTLSIGGLESNANTPYKGCDKLYARSYIKYRDASGNTKTVYSDVSSFTDGINSLVNSAKTSKSI